MKQWLTFASEHAIVIIDAISLAIVVIGTIEAAVKGFVLLFSSSTGEEQRNVWLRYGSWLVAGLTFQLAADIIETSITTDWNAIGRIAAIAVIRTFLNYFLERDIAEIRARRLEGANDDSSR